MHTKSLKKGLDRVIVMDSLIRHIAAQASPDTLIVFAADHSYSLRTRGGNRDKPFADQVNADLASTVSSPAIKPTISVDDSHTGEEILVAAQGPGAERVRGFMPNTEIFRIMMDAYGWKVE